MSEELTLLKDQLAELERQRKAIDQEIAALDREILRLESEASPWRVGMVLERTYRVRRQITSMRWEDGPMRAERAVVTGTERRWCGSVVPTLRRILKDGSLGKQTPHYHDYDKWTPTGETVELEQS